MRWRVFQKLFIDDALVVFAYLQLLAFAIVWQEYANDLYVIFAVATGQEAPVADMLERVYRFQTAEIICNMLYGFTLWSIKLAFLLFFRRIGHHVRHQNAIWWSVLTWNAIAFVIWIGVINWRCEASRAAVSQSIK